MKLNKEQANRNRNTIGCYQKTKNSMHSFGVSKNKNCAIKKFACQIYSQKLFWLSKNRFCQKRKASFGLDIDTKSFFEVKKLCKNIVNSAITESKMHSITITLKLCE